MGQTEPGQLLAELRQQVVGEEAHHPSQDVQHKTQSGLEMGEEARGEDRTKVRRKTHELSYFQRHSCAVEPCPPNNLIERHL